jgi:hypothetical protein
MLLPLPLLLLPTDVAGCCSVVLPLLADSQGLGSSVPDIRGVAADVLCSGIKTAGSAQVCTYMALPLQALLQCNKLKLVLE